MAGWFLYPIKYVLWYCIKVSWCFYSYGLKKRKSICYSMAKRFRRIRSQGRRQYFGTCSKIVAIEWEDYNKFYNKIGSKPYTKEELK